MTNQMITTATDQVTTLTASLTAGLKRGEQYVALLNQLATTDDYDQLLDAAQQLIDFDLQDAYVKFPQHYEPEDYYLLLMGRILELGEVSGLAIHPDPLRRRLTMRVTAFDNDYNFCFERKRNQDGAFFAEQGDHEPLFNLDLAHQALQFDNQALVDFLIVKEVQRHNDLELQQLVAPLVSFAHLLAEKLGFTINLGILATANDSSFKLAAPELELTVIDKLFIKTADTATALLSLPKNNGAKLQLGAGVSLILAFDPDDYTQQWFFRVVDPDESLSFVDVLLHYELVRDWYLTNRNELAIMDNRFSFTPDRVVVTHTPATDADPVMDEAPKSAVEDEDDEDDVPSSSAATEKQATGDDDAPQSAASDDQEKGED